MNGVLQVEQTLRVLGLTRCRNTVVGNALLRGISGGEKKRLTTAEMTGKWGADMCGVGAGRTAIATCGLGVHGWMHCVLAFASPSCIGSCPSHVSVLP